jgi:hypothetical protein
MSITTTGAVSTFCDAVMIKVVRSNVVNHDNLDTAVSVIREEVKAFLAGKGQDYSDTRALVADGTLRANTGANMVALNAIRRIREA